jgi:hypothetical protein
MQQNFIKAIKVTHSCLALMTFLLNEMPYLPPVETDHFTLLTILCVVQSPILQASAI